MRTIRRFYTSLRKRVHNFVFRNGMPLDMFWLIHALTMSRCIYAVAKLGIPDLLRQGPKTTKELAKLTETQEPELYRVLRALASIGIFAEDKQGRFELTPKAESLCEDAPISLKSWTILCGEEGWGACAQIVPALKTGTGAFELAHGMKCWDYFEKHEEQRKLFDQGMGAWTQMHGPVIAADLDLSGVKELVDVGGGRGSLMIALLKANPHLKGYVFDRPEAGDICRAALKEAGVADRAEAVGGNFLEKVPACEAYTIKHVLHDWANDFVVQVLKSVRAVIKPGGRLFIIDAVVEPGNNTDRLVKWWDIMQMAATSGHERTEEEFRELLGEAGFRLNSITHTAIEDVDILECIPC